MKEQLKLLIELQVHDAKIQELEGALKAFPAKFEAMHADVRKVEALLERERTQLHDTEAWRKRQETEARDQEDALIRAKQRSSMVKNVKEHMANERELESNRKNTQSREEEVARLSGAVVTAKKALEQHEKDFAEMKSHVTGEEAAARSEMSAVEKQIAAAKRGREDAANAVDPAALKRYSAIRMRRGLALAPVKAGTCQGCHMNIPPQLFNTLQRGLSIETCPNCNRIIYWDRILNPDGAAAEKVAAKPAEKPDKPKAKKAVAQKGPVTPFVARQSVTHANVDTTPKAPKAPLAAPAGSDLGTFMSPPSATTAASSKAPETRTDNATHDDAPEGEAAPEAPHST